MQVIHHNGDAVPVPCGKCAFCLTNKRASWMFRIHHEMKVQEHPGFFLTFTYDEKHVRRTPEGLSLRFRDIQLFFKKIRKARYVAKYVCVGEYGPATERPHYHTLLWTDCPADKIESIWKMGAIHFGRLTMQSAMYTLKYVIQPKAKAVFKKRERPRAQFSKGIGLGYLTTQVYDYHTMDYDNPVLFSRIDGRQVALPRYYRNKIFTKFQLKQYARKAKWDSIRNRRRYMRELIAQGVVGTKSYIEKLRAEQCRRIISTTKFNQVL